MQKVWTLMRVERYEGTQLLGVFSTQEKATAAYDARDADYKKYYPLCAGHAAWHDECAHEDYTSIDMEIVDAT
jgi:hypothetical protein